MLAKNLRHFSKLEITKVFLKSKKIKGLYLDLFWHKNRDNKILIINSKKYEKKAVLRNKLKRQLFLVFYNEVILKRSDGLDLTPILHPSRSTRKAKNNFLLFHDEVVTSPPLDKISFSMAKSNSKNHNLSVKSGKLEYNYYVSGFFIVKIKAKASFDEYVNEMTTILRGLR